MSTIYVISDLHLGHNFLKKLRGFATIEEHDQAIVDGWNSVVKSKHDVVWILGDIAMDASMYPMLDKLKGRKKVILGNHDRYRDVPELLKYVDNVSGCFVKDKVMFSHCPIHERELEFNRKNVHGHIHNNFIDDSRYINVSCEVLDYKPVKMSDLLK